MISNQLLTEKTQIHQPMEQKGREEFKNLEPTPK